MKWISLALLAIGLFPLKVLSQAAASTSGTLVRVSTGAGGEGLYLNVNTLNSACATPVYINGVQASPYYFMSTSSPQYKETVAMALTAWALGQTLYIIYQPTCSGGNQLALLALTYGG